MSVWGLATTSPGMASTPAVTLIRTPPPTHTRFADSGVCRVCAFLPGLALDSIPVMPRDGLLLRLVSIFER